MAGFKGQFEAMLGSQETSVVMKNAILSIQIIQNASHGPPTAPESFDFTRVFPIKDAVALLEEELM